MTTSNKHKAISLIQAVAGDVDALSFIDSAQFVQHDPDIADGVDGYKRWLEDQPASASVDVIRVFEDGDYVFAHSLYDLGETKAGIDVFRFEDGKIVEHWSNFQTFVEPNPSGHTLTDGATTLSDLDQTEQNKKLVHEFLSTHLVEGSTDISGFFAGENYIQHNPGIADGVSGLLEAGKAFRDQGIIASFTAIHNVLGEGNFVLALSEGQVGTDPSAFFDLYRLENGTIAEHWDVIQAITPVEASQNGNGKF